METVQIAQLEAFHGPFRDPEIPVHEDPETAFQDRFVRKAVKISHIDAPVRIGITVVRFIRLIGHFDASVPVEDVVREPYPGIELDIAFRSGILFRADGVDIQDQFPVFGRPIPGQTDIIVFIVKNGFVHGRHPPVEAIRHEIYNYYTPS